MGTELVYHEDGAKFPQAAVSDAGSNAREHLEGAKKDGKCDEDTSQKVLQGCRILSYAVQKVSGSRVASAKANLFVSMSVVNFLSLISLAVEPKWFSIVSWPFWRIFWGPCKNRCPSQVDPTTRIRSPQARISNKPAQAIKQASDC